MLTLIVILAALLTLSVMAHMKARGQSFRSLFTGCIRCMAYALGLHLIPRKHRRKLHLGVLGAIAYDVMHSGARLGDLGFLFLSVLMEAETAADTATPPSPPASPTFPLRTDRSLADDVWNDPEMAAIARTFTIDRVAERTAALIAWAKGEGVVFVTRSASSDNLDVMGESWHGDEQGALELEPTDAVSVRNAAIKRARSYVWVRQTLSPSLYLSTLIHELGHTFGVVRADVLHLAANPVDWDNMPCWAPMPLTRFAGPAAVESIVAELNAEGVVYEVLTAWGADTRLTDRYLKTTPLAMPACVRRDNATVAARLILAMDGKGDHAALY